MCSLGYSGCYAISCEDRSGSLALFWKQPFTVSLRGANSQVIDVTVTVVVASMTYPSTMEKKCGTRQRWRSRGIG